MVAYRFSEAFWVSYKLYSAFGFTLVLTILTALIIAPHMHDEDSDGNPSKHGEPDPIPENK